MKYLDSFRSIVASLRAARIVGQAFRLQEQGRLTDAGNAALAGLALLRQPFVNRQSPPTASALAALTVVAEESCQPGVAGASLEDLADSLAFLRSINHAPEPDLCRSIPFLERRLVARSAGGA
jgi:hypothetical protein